MNPSRDPEFGGVAISLRPIDRLLPLSLFIYGSESIWETIKIPFEITILSQPRGHGRDSAVFRPPQPFFTVEALDWTAKHANAIIEATLFIIWQHFLDSFVTDFLCLISVDHLMEASENIASSKPFEHDTRL